MSPKFAPIRGQLRLSSVNLHSISRSETTGILTEILNFFPDSISSLLRYGADLIPSLCDCVGHKRYEIHFDFLSKRIFQIYLCLTQMSPKFAPYGAIQCLGQKPLACSVILILCPDSTFKFAPDLGDDSGMKLHLDMCHSKPYQFFFVVSPQIYNKEVVDFGNNIQVWRFWAHNSQITNIPTDVNTVN